MVKHYCDCCQKEFPQTELNKFRYLCHLDKIVDGNGLSCTIDRNGHRTSGRMEEYELCNGCYNDVVHPSVSKLRELQEKYLNDNPTTSE